MEQKAYDIPELLALRCAADSKKLTFTHDAKSLQLIRGDEIHESQFLSMTEVKRPELRSLPVKSTRQNSPKPLPPMLLKFMQEEAERIKVAFPRAINELADPSPNEGLLTMIQESASESTSVLPHSASSIGDRLATIFEGCSLSTIEDTHVEDVVDGSDLESLAAVECEARSTDASAGSESSFAASSMELTLDLDTCVTPFPLDDSMENDDTVFRFEAAQGDQSEICSHRGVKNFVGSTCSDPDSSTCRAESLSTSSNTILAIHSPRPACSDTSDDSEAEALDDAHGLTQAPGVGMAQEATSPSQMRTPQPTSRTKYHVLSNQDFSNNIHSLTLQDSINERLLVSTGVKNGSEIDFTSSTSNAKIDILPQQSQISGEDSYLSTDEIYPLEHNPSWGERPKTLIAWERTAPTPPEPTILPDETEFRVEDIISEDERLWLEMKQSWDFESYSVDRWLSVLDLDGEAKAPPLNTEDIPRSKSPPPELQKVLNRKFEDASGPLYRKMMRRFESGRSFLPCSRSSQRNARSCRDGDEQYRGSDVRAMYQKRKVKQLAASSDRVSISSEDDLH